MKLQTIEVTNFQGVRHFAASLSAPVQIIAGPNASGKSTIRDAIELALTGSPRRVSLKKDFAKLVYEGARSGRVALQFEDGGLASFTVPAGDWHNRGSDLDPRELAIALDAQRFAAMKTEDRRAFLFAAMRVPTKPDQVKARLLTMDLAPKLLDQVSPMLAGGFEPAHKEAAGMAREEKAAWRTVTGEQWGAQKAEDWQPHGDPWTADDDAALDEASAALAAARGALEAQVAAAASYASARREYEGAAGRRNGLKARADKVKEYAENSERAQRDLYEQREKVAAMRKALEAERHYDCPSCGALLKLDASVGDLVEVERTANVVVVQPPAGDLAEHEQAERMLANALNNRQRLYADAEAAVLELSTFKMPEPPGDLPGSDAPLRATIKAADEKAAAMLNAKRTAEARTQKGKDAARLHESVKAWIAIADALSPDGLPATLLAEALGPLNDRAAWAARVAKWHPPQLAADMTITVAGREYALLSESEKWRADACFAVAFAAAMSSGIVMLDRWDVLEPSARGQPLAMLRAVREPFGIATAFLFGTLKQPPTGLPSGVAVHWLPDVVRERKPEPATV